MAHEVVRPLRSEEDYDIALKEIEPYRARAHTRNSEAHRFERLALVIEEYEKKHWPVELPDAVDARRYRRGT